MRSSHAGPMALALPARIRSNIASPTRSSCMAFIYARHDDASSRTPGPADGAWVSYRVEAGSVQVIPAFLVHRVRWSAPAEWIGLLVEPAFLQAVAGDGTVDLRARFGVDDALLRQLLLALREEVRDGGR